MKKTLAVYSSDELIVEEYLKEWKVNYKLKGQGSAIDANEIDGVAKRLTNKCILHVVL